MDTLKLLFQLYFRPAFAMSEIIDRGSWLFAAALVLVISAAFFLTVNTKLQAAYRIPSISEFYDYSMETDAPNAEDEYNKALAEYKKALASRRTIPVVGDTFFRFFSFEPEKFYQPLLSISVFYVPVVILLMCLLGGAGGFGVVLQRSYGELATCTLVAWAAAHLPFVVAGMLLYSSDVSPPVLLAMWAASSLLFGVF